jgi:hypothetical protein
MVTHDELSLCALLLAGIAGALLANPLGDAMRQAFQRIRAANRR